MITQLSVGWSIRGCRCGAIVWSWAPAVVWYYERSTAATRVARDVALRNSIRRIVLAFPGHGYGRMTKPLMRGAWTVDHKRVLRVMR